MVQAKGNKTGTSKIRTTFQAKAHRNAQGGFKETFSVVKEYPNGQPAASKKAFISVKTTKIPDLTRKDFEKSKVGTISA